MAGNDDELVVRAFNGAINGRDPDALAALMTDDHRFVDTSGASIEGRAACLGAWRDFLAAYPDYRNSFDEVVGHGTGVVDVRGHSRCSTTQLDGPARWRAMVNGGKVAEWRVFDIDPAAD